jgi:hypothetical protein
MAHGAVAPTFRRLKAVAAVALVIWLVAVRAKAQQATLPDAPGATVHANVDPPMALRPIPREHTTLPTHPFWDRTNKLLFAGVGALRGLDYASTRNMQARGRKEILLAQDVVNNDAGFAALEAAGTATSIALSYWLHRTGHHKLERWLSIGHIAVTGFGVARNYALKTKH